MARVNVRPLAEADLADAYAWYETQSSGLGAQFIDEVHAVYEHVEQFPEGFPDVYRGTRRALVRRLPYALYYRVLDEIAHVIACAHVRRHPRAWRSRMERGLSNREDG
ncbi:MAG: type II toxin-antitoxin system RelE/ParE family toxin [Gemmatimonadota bacterium]|nr:type II toxin-antitoxin system RelE/ParE family toxin [Gemmatimonadota bacterium]